MSNPEQLGEKAPKNKNPKSCFAIREEKNIEDGGLSRFHLLEIIHRAPLFQSVQLAK